jgi:hypothetical protein
LRIKKIAHAVFDSPRDNGKESNLISCYASHDGRKLRHNPDLVLSPLSIGGTRYP